MNYKKQKADTPLKAIYRLSFSSILLILLAMITLPLHPSRLYLWLDGANELLNVNTQHHWMSSYTFGVNTFSGLQDASFPVLFNLMPIYTLTHALMGHLLIYSTVTYALFSLEYFFAAYLLCRVFKIPKNISLLSAWLITLFVMPLLPVSSSKIPLFYSITTLNPAFIDRMFFTSLLIYSYSYLGKQRQLYSSILLGCFTLLIAIYLILSTAVSILTIVPFTFLLTLFLLLFSETRKEFSVKLTTIIIGLLLLAILKYPQFLLGFFLYSTPAFFPQTLTTSFAISYISILFIAISHMYVSGTYIAGLGIIGAILVIFLKQKQKKFAVIFLTFIVIILAFGYITVIFPNFYHGPFSLYYEFVLWPLYMGYGLIAISYGFKAVQFILLKCIDFCSSSNKTSLKRKIDVLFFYGGKNILLIPLICLVALIVNFVFSKTEPPVQFYPFSKNPPPIIKYLHDHIGLYHGNIFNGYAASFFPKPKSGIKVEWIEQDTFDSLVLLPRFHNPHRLVGLWFYNIPTLEEYSPTLSPALYILVSKVLSRPIDTQTRNIFTLTKINIPFLQALGVKYIITNNTVYNQDAKFIMSEFIDKDHGSLYLYKLTRANIATYSPNKFIVLNNVKQFIDDINNQKINFLTTVYVTKPIAISTTKLSQSIMRPIQNGINITALSDGASAIVVPVLYSHCLRVKFNGQKPSIFKFQRANLAESLLIFDKRVNVDITYRYGLQKYADCRLEDRKDLQRILLSNAQP